MNSTRRSIVARSIAAARPIYAFIVILTVIGCFQPGMALGGATQEKTVAPWRSGEKTIYSIGLSGIEIALARVSIGKFDSDSIVARIASETLPSFSNILRVKDDISSWISLEGLMPNRSNMHAIYKTRESTTKNEIVQTKGGIRLKQRVEALVPNKKDSRKKAKRAWSTTKRYPAKLHDPVSVLLSLRHREITSGQSFDYFVMSGRKKYIAHLVATGLESIRLNGRKMKAMRLQGNLQRTSGSRKLVRHGKVRNFSIWLETSGAKRALKATIKSPLGAINIGLKQSSLGKQPVQAFSAPATLPEKLRQALPAKR